MTIVPEQLSKAREEYSEQAKNGNLILYFVTSFAPTTSTTVTHWSWYSSNGLKARVVETQHAKAKPSYEITDWSEGTPPVPSSTEGITLQSIINNGNPPK